MSALADFVYKRSYQGKIKAAILDWSGTTADAYVIAPTVVFVEIFKKHGVEISMLEARGPMGLRKDKHIQTLLEDPSIRERWKAVKGVYPTDQDVQILFEEAVPVQLEVLPKYTGLLPGVPEVAKKIQESGVKIGVTTGFTKSMVDVLLKDVLAAGFHPDSTVAGDEVTNGSRPKPHMLYKNLDMLDITSIQSVVKVDDTTTGIDEALNAGCWAVGVARYSNYMNINSYEEAAALPQEEIDLRVEATRNILRKAGAHYVIDSIVDLPEVIEDINRRLALGEKP
ncbi:phosphonoacetaldehyde hydrolase [Flexibacterium corallicola]|uniref:phosphonoacetaldehyde hydrolase n=1 Tax=Flexibacterium corallicola TaxID=3037259 RepID=UPI00286EE715|nr:phosphonoacetaldehyde hydrolase [Pseudovibrio sp. M1P-2-3]